MVKIMEKPMKMDDLRGKPPIFGNPHIYSYILLILQSAALSVGQIWKNDSLESSWCFKATWKMYCSSKCTKMIPPTFSNSNCSPRWGWESGMVKSSPKKTTQKVEENRDATSQNKILSRITTELLLMVQKSQATTVWKKKRRITG